MTERTLRSCQREVDEWINTIGVRYFSELTNTAVLMEEVGELARLMARTYGEQSFKEGEAADLGMEMADVLFVLICLANQTGVDLQSAMAASMRSATRSQISSTMMVSWEMAIWGPWVSTQPAGTRSGQLSAVARRSWYGRMCFRCMAHSPGGSGSQQVGQCRIQAIFKPDDFQARRLSSQTTFKIGGSRTSSRARRV